MHLADFVKIPLLRFLVFRKKLQKRYWCWRACRTVESFGSPPKINQACKFTPRTSLGVNCNFNGMSIAGGGRVVIGDNFHSGIECRMITQIHRYDDGNAIPYDTKLYILQDIEIGDNVWLGDRVIVLGGTKIGEGAIIQAGSVVVNDIPPLAIAGGHPAKVFKQRNKGHYFKLKDEKKFH